MLRQKKYLSQGEGNYRGDFVDSSGNMKGFLSQAEGNYRGGGGLCRFSRQHERGLVTRGG